MPEKTLEQMITDLERYVRELARVMPPGSGPVVKQTEAKALATLKQMRERLAEGG